MQTNTYLLFKGDCEAAFKHYAEVLGGKIEAMLKQADTPMAAQCAEGMRDKIAHARMSLGSNFLMASDCPPDQYTAPTGFSVNIGVDTPAEAERVYKELSEGGNVTMALQETFWAQRFGMFTDRFGTPWMINCEKPRPN